MLQEKTSLLSHRVQNGEPVKLVFHYNTKHIDKFINSLFMKILSRNDMNYLHGVIESILREMIVNAVKANSKRVYFEENNLNINNIDHYNSGMEEFKSYFIDDSSVIQSELKKSGYQIELILKKSEDGFNIIVKNNAALLPYEEERIKLRMEKSKEYNDFSDIYMDVSDDQEGEGLGISLTMLFLKNSGIGENSFNISSNGIDTRSTITIPFTTRPPETIELIMNKIMNEIDELPTFPENVLELQSMCHDVNVDIDDISSKIALDPSLAASVVKLSNSAGFVTIRKTENIKDAVKIIGLKNLNSILITSATKKIMDDRFNFFKDVWSHSNKAAFYARELAIKFGFKRDADKFYLSAMLHDLGKIVLLAANSELTDQIESVTVRRQMRTSTVLEEVTMGVSHSTVGRLIAEKWNFPDYIVEAIALHHCPVEVSEENTDIVFITYIANSMCLLEEKKFDFLNMENAVLERFKLKDENKFRNLHQELMLRHENNEEMTMQ